MPLRRGFLLRGNKWPTGKDGILHIAHDQVVTLAPGALKDYTSVQIDDATGGTNPGILEVSSGTAWVIVGCASSFVNNGIVRYKQADNGGVLGTFTATSPDTRSLSYTIPAPGNGGNGGAGGNVPSGNISGGSGSAFGTGGGGGGGSASFGVEYLAGQVGNPGNSSGGGTGGHGGTTSQSTGGDGGDGGMRGLNGGAMYIACATLSGSGSFDFSGTNGQNGTVGGDPVIEDGDAGNGGGGGGGSGGSGGKLVVFAPAGNTFNPLNVNVSKGLKGSGGAKGNGGTGGANGSNGSDGTSDGVYQTV